MFKSFNKKNLTKENINNKVDEYSILKYYFPAFNGVGKYTSNLRPNDKNGSLHFTYLNNKFVISDFGIKDYIGISTYDYLRILFNYPLNNEGYLRILDKIVVDFGLDKEIKRFNNKGVYYNEKVMEKQPKIYNIKQENKSKTTIQIKKRKWFSWKVDDTFWGIIANKDSLMNEFNLYNIVPLSYYWVNQIRFKVDYRNPTYAFVINGEKKLYSPFDKKFKWISNITNHKVIGWHTLQKEANYILIEKSLKDVIVAKTIAGITNAIPMNSESMFIGKRYVDYLLSNYKNVYAHFDNDEPGINAAGKFAELYPGLKTFTFPINLPKDNYEFIIQNKKEELKQELNKIIN